VSAKADTATATETKTVGAHPRIVALVGLTAVLAGLFYSGRAVYYAFTDSWMAPITLSPDNDQVLQINVKLNEQQLQRDKLRTDIERIDADIVGVDAAVARIRTIQDMKKDTLRWTAFTNGAQSSAATARLHSLDEQRKLFESMLARQEEFARSAKRSADAGLLTKQELEREEQTLDQLRLGLSTTLRDTTEARAQNEHLLTAGSVLRNAMKSGPAQGAGPGVLPEIAAGEDHEVRMTLELIKLEAERRALVAQRAMSVEGMERMDEVFKQLKARPLYRAVAAKTDIAFIPYTQLETVEPGATLISCAWTLFRCHAVGRIAEILPGEVVAQDPWSNVSRGQYAILDLREHEAAKEKVLRARRVK